jgi:uncharacterized alpha-E superfamily protein
MMLSRVAERVYWMARYLERADNTARLLSAHTVLLMDLPETLEYDWFTPVVIFNAETQYKENYPEVSEENVMRFLIADKDNPSSLLGSFASVRENVRTSLDLLPEEIWEQVNQTYMQLQAALPSLSSRHSRQMVLRDVMAACQRIRGVLESHLSRDHAFDFIQIGKHVERADMTSRTLEMTSLLLAEDRSHALRRYESILWASLLSTLGAQQMYLRHMNSRIIARDVLQFLCQDLQFPRSLLYSLKAVNYYLSRLPEPEAVQAIASRIAEQFAKEDISAIPVDQIHWFMDRLQADLTLLHNDIAETWFYPETDFSQLQAQS